MKSRLRVDIEIRVEMGAGCFLEAVESGVRARFEYTGPRPEGTR